MLLERDFSLIELSLFVAVLVYEHWVPRVRHLEGASVRALVGAATGAAMSARRALVPAGRLCKRRSGRQNFETIARNGAPVEATAWKSNFLLQT